MRSVLDIWFFPFALRVKTKKQYTVGYSEKVEKVDKKNSTAKALKVAFSVPQRRGLQGRNSRLKQDS